MKRAKNKKTHREEFETDLDVDGLSTELPDLDNLVDPAADFDARPIRDRFRVSRAAWSMRERSRKIVTFDARKVHIAAETLGSLPAAGEYIHMICGQEFAGFDLLPAMLSLSGKNRFDSLYLTTLGFSRDNLAQLELLLRAKQIPPARLSILCGDFFRRADSSLWDIGTLLAREWGFTFKSFRNHTKLILAQLADAHYVVETSANLRSCANLEHFTLTRSDRLFQFHATWIRDCLAFAKA